MTKVTATIGAPPDTNTILRYARWGAAIGAVMRPGDGIITLPGSMIADGKPAEIGRLQIQEAFGHRSVDIDLIPETVDGTTREPAFSAKLLRFGEALVFEAGGETLTLPGPTGRINQFGQHVGDSTAPYTYDPGVPIAAFAQHVIGLTAEQQAAITLTVQDQIGVRIAGRQEIEGTGSSALEVNYPVRIGGRQEIAGTGSSAVEITTDVRIAGRQEIEGTGASEVEVINPTRIAGRQEIEGTGGSGVEVTQPTRIAGRQEIEGTGSSALRIVAPVRIAGRQEIAGTGSSLLEIVQPLGWDTEIRASSPRAAIITALEIEHPDASAPLRVVDAAEDRTIGGETYAALRFDAKLAFDDESRAPHAEISIDNVGRVGTEWLEETRGGAGATVRIMQALDVAPHVVEWEMTLDLLRTAVDSDRIAARLGFDPGLGRGAVAMRHDPATTPGIF